MHNKKAFTLIEVLLAVLLLFGAGTALISVERKIVKDLSANRSKSRLMLTATPVLTLPIEAIRKRRTPLYRLVRFPKLRDDEIFYLKQTKIEARRHRPRREILFESLRYNVWPVTLTDTHSRLRFIRITP